MDVLVGRCREYGDLLRSISGSIRFIGMNILHPDYEKITFGFVFMMTSIVIYLIVQIWSFVRVAHDLMEAVYSVVTFGIFLQVLDSVTVLVG